MIVLVITYYSQDRDAADTLCRFIADIEPKRRKDVRIRIVPRFDAEHLEISTLSYLSQKFDVSWNRSSLYRWTGWPAGPNGMAKEVIVDAPAWLRATGWEDADGILLLEPDCVPLKADWLDQILADWADANKQGAWLMGSWRNSGGRHGHINGNCVMRPDIGELAKVEATVGPDLAWDCAIAPLAHNHWVKSGLFLNRFHSRNATEQVLNTPEIGTVAPALCHGFKDQSCLDIARKWILNK